MFKNRIRLKDLELVRHIAEAGSITGAAALANVSQPAASQRLMSLQSRLGSKLFLRSAGVMQPTREGKRLLDAAQVIQTELDQLCDDLTGQQHQRATQLRVATQCYTLYRWLPLVIRKLLSAYPNLEVDVVPEATDRAAVAVANDELDVALISHAPQQASGARLLFEDELFAVMSPTHPLAKCSWLDPGQFVDQSLLLYTGEKHAIVEEVLKPAGVPAPHIIQIRITEAIVELARAAKGIAVLAGWVLHDLPETRDLVPVRITPGGFLRQWYGITNPAAPADHTDAFLDMVRDIGYQLAQPNWRSRVAANGKPEP